MDLLQLMSFNMRFLGPCKFDIKFSEILLLSLQDLLSLHYMQF